MEAKRLHTFVLFIHNGLWRETLYVLMDLTNEVYVNKVMQAIEDIIIQDGIIKAWQNVAETLTRLRKECPDCQKQISESLEEIRVRNNLSFSWDEFIPTDTSTEN